ncbi:hypothetical protein ACWT_3361 [Actinoplanes sp. SE50]|uniref:DUF397 domain-containing protein n=1 Tax=unclassified Actinoplanes TaxID=2626549 RepID=UPI00023ED076|nr:MULTISPECIES: DUF397 domain-containing protein [unclassified Actinoplanes]AEV84384.1 hypothetical protein ACPL_3489 [Actinoplanes sp. SE50/110]ATO82776.1 hypothetical protein ACWT_3361 [Actinoplanes sp. SE50]SLM00184.1 hypothetical protein ACSP50_3416 [Actinoplanes sp. SE50/110]
MTDPSFTQWRTSSRSSGGANCVEVSPADNAPLIAVRDTKNRSGGMLVFTGRTWADFIAVVRAGEFD